MDALHFLTFSFFSQKSFFSFSHLLLLLASYATMAAITHRQPRRPIMRAFGSLLILFVESTRAFVVLPAPTCSSRKLSPSSDSSLLGALTERQMQFWEDVEEGLDDVEAYYATKGMDIDRVRDFGKR